VFFLEHCPKDLAEMRQLIFKMVSSASEFQIKISELGGERNFVQSIAIVWHYKSNEGKLSTEQDFQNMARTLSQVCRSADTKNLEANTSDLDSSVVSIKFNNSQNPKVVVKITAFLQDL